MSDIFTGTPAGLTYDHEVVRQAWMAVWMITSGLLVVIVGWMGLSLIVGDHVGRAQAGWRELVPRLLLGLVAAAASLWWCALVIDVADAVSGFIAAELGVTAGDMLRSTLQTLLRAVQVGSVGMALLLALIYLVYGFFVLYLVVQMVLRLALIDILLALAPVALGLWILPHTAGWGRHWLRLFMTTVFQQAIQLVALALGIGFLNQYAAIGGADAMQDLAWKLLMSLAFIYLATRVPSMLGNAGTFDAWLHTLYFGMSLPGSLARSARSAGLLMGGGAAGGPAGAALAAGAAGAAAGAGASAAASGVSSAAQSSTPSSGGGNAAPGSGLPRSSGE
ncbi:MAG: type IV secretion system protein [Acidimicrobiia bacterium]|nr:type IV secretion system protein [Chloroflexota bacterium]MXY85252.1 type IV secretion system protein [Chloroflexota bacterium]MYG92650.1 type IV secretion system protein [Acidimicrobiia bacterium]